MKSRLSIGIISIVMSVIVLLQSCVAGIATALEESDDLSGSAGLILALCLLVAGILGICYRNSFKKGPYVTAGFYLFGAFVALSNIGIYEDLIVWSIISIAFAFTFILTNIVHNRKSKSNIN